MENKLKKHIGLIILLIIALVFPTSLSYQARLNMRIIVTGLAIDKKQDEYHVTAQVVKTVPGSKPPGTSAEIDFLMDKSRVLSEAVAKLAYKAGKVASFSHTNFIIIGKSILEDDVTQCLDYFVRDKVIKNSALILFSDDDAGKELQKTQKTELSVGIGLQKVYTFKEHNSDGLMVTMIDFLKNSRSNTGTAVASSFALETNKEQEAENSGGSQASGQSGGETGGQSGSGEESSSSASGSPGGSGGQGESGGGEGGSGGGSGGEEYQYFKQDLPLMCFVDGKFKGKIETEKDIDGFMLVYPKAKTLEITLEDVSGGRFNQSSIEVVVQSKNNRLKVRYENGEPICDISIMVGKSEIGEILSDGVIGVLTDEEFNIVMEELKKDIAEKVNSCFELAKSFGVDIFNTYDYAYKFNYKETISKYDTKEEFLKAVKLNIKVNVRQLEY